jgi:DeoR/GlpR family transcriptional regulator of sugar metabolism
MIVRNPPSHERRKRIILNHINKEEEISIFRIAELCNISPVTARRDLVEMEQKGLLIRTHGGAIKSNTTQNLFSFENKAQLNKSAKERIARSASFFIEEGDVIYIDCGTTVFYLTRYLPRFRYLRIITNSLPVVSELTSYPHIKVNLIGGELDHERKALYGPMTENFLDKYRARKAFIGAAGMTIETGLTSNGEKEGAITGKMASIAEEVYLLCDSTKIGKDSFSPYAPLTIANTIITDQGVDPSIVTRVREMNIKIITV